MKSTGVQQHMFTADTFSSEGLEEIRNTNLSANLKLTDLLKARLAFSASKKNVLTSGEP